MKRKIGVGIVGFGNMGKVHACSVGSLKYFYDLDTFDPYVAGICASTVENSSKYAETYPVGKAFESFDELIESDDVDVVDICTPNIFHASQLEKAIKAGKSIYCEKPLAVTYEEAIKVANAADKAGITNGIVFNTRFLLPVIRAKEIIMSGRIGNVVSFDIKFLHSSALDKSKTGWKQDSRICGGGSLFDLGSHAVDLMLYLCGTPVKVYGRSQIVFDRRTSFDGEENWKTNADEAFYVSATLENNAEGNITVGKIFNGTNDDFSFEIYGTKGYLKFGLMEPNWLYYYDGASEPLTRGITRIECVGRYSAPATGFPGIKAPVGWLRGHIGSMHNFLSNVSLNKPSTPSFKDGAKVQKILEISTESAEKGVPVYVG